MIYLIEETEGYSQRELARMLLRYGLYEEYGIREEVRIEKDLLGKPFFADLPWISFNYSHCPQGILCGIHREAIGVDIQGTIAYKENLMRKICHEKERSCMENAEDKDRMLTRIWTAKESYLKYLGTGIRVDLRSIDLSGCQSDFFQQQECYFHVVSKKDYSFSVCAKEPELSIRKIKLGELKKFQECK